MSFPLVAVVVVFCYFIHFSFFNCLIFYSSNALKFNQFKVAKLFFFCCSFLVLFYFRFGKISGSLIFYDFLFILVLFYNSLLMGKSNFAVCSFVGFFLVLTLVKLLLGGSGFEIWMNFWNKLLFSTQLLMQ